MPNDDNANAVHFGWDLTYACNYKCPYCQLPPPSPPRPVSQWVKIWERICQKYGRCYIYMSGGEPSVYPGFYELVKALIAMHTVDICTNLSWQVERLVPEFSTKHLRISATFHPTQAPFEEFLAKAVYVRDYLPQRRTLQRLIAFVADPGQMENMKKYQAVLDEKGFSLIPQPLMVDGKIANNEEEKQLIGEISPVRDIPSRKLEYQLKILAPKGKLCRAGQQYCLIRGDGMVDRCTRHEDRQLGSIFSGNFALWTEPKVCQQDWCPFESQWLVP